MSTILVVDDVPAMAEQYAYDLKRVGGYDVLVALSGRAALDLLEREAVDCVILDLEMPGMDGFEVLRTMERRGLRMPVLVYTGTGNYDRCTEAIRLGARSFIDKAEPMERVVQEVEHALEQQRVAGQLAALRGRLDSEAPLVGASPAMQALKDAIGRVAKIPSPVLIVGESGSGKELVARELHRLGANPAGPFIALNAAAIPENLVEDELFGHERGAFTGAGALRKGAFEAASGGTLFLDEIGELPLAAQAKLLRVIEQRQITRLGGNRTVAVTARVVAATNRDLEAEVRAGRFDWTRNNVRELRNAVERMIIATDGETIGVENIPVDIQESAGPQASAAGGPAPTTFHALKAEAERQIIVAALEHNDWRITRTAQALGLADHASLLKIMRRHNISRGRVDSDT